MKQIVYLDQSYVSNFAKALYVDDWNDPDRDQYLELVRALRSATNANTIICPESDLHRVEAEQSTRVASIVWRVTRDLSRGLRLRSPYDLGFAQMELLASGDDHSALFDWHVAYHSDPHTIVEPETSPRIEVHFVSPEEFTSWERGMKTLVGGTYAGYRESRIEAGLSFASEVEFARRQLVRETFRPFNPAWLDGTDISRLMYALEPRVVHTQRRIFELAAKRGIADRS